MPYKYKNVLNFQGTDETIREVLRTIQHPEFGKGTIDFHAITPVPPWVAAGGQVATGQSPLERWRLEHWGVGAGPSGLAESAAGYDGGPTIEFDTIGSHVRELMRCLSLMFPARRDLIVDYLWASENVGRDSGMVQYQRGELLYEYLPEPGSMEAYKLAFDILGTEPRDHGLVLDEQTGAYRYGGKLIGASETQ